MFDIIKNMVAESFNIYAYVILIVGAILIIGFLILKNKTQTKSNDLPNNPNNPEDNDPIDDNPIDDNPIPIPIDDNPTDNPDIINLNILKPGGVMIPGDKLVSKDFIVTITKDFKFVILKKSTPTKLYYILRGFNKSKTSKVEMSLTGVLVCFNTDNKIYYQSTESNLGVPGSSLQLTNDGLLEVVDPNNRIMWVIKYGFDTIEDTDEDTAPCAVS